MGSKGVSPLIATILLIAFTISVAGIIGVWLTGLTRTQTSNVENIADKVTRCAASTLIIKSAYYPANPSSNHFVNVTLTYETGSELLYNLTVEVTGGGKVSTSTTNFTVTPMQPGQAYAVSIDTTGGANLPPDFIRARAMCLSSVAIIGECKFGQTCMSAA